MSVSKVIIDKFFTSTRLDRCSNDKCNHHDLENMQCQLKETIMTSKGECLYYFNQKSVAEHSNTQMYDDGKRK